MDVRQLTPTAAAAVTSLKSLESIIRLVGCLQRGGGGRMRLSTMFGREPCKPQEVKMACWHGMTKRHGICFALEWVTSTALGQQRVEGDSL